MEMTGLWQQRGGTLTGMAVANTAEAQSHYNTRLHGTHRGSEDGLCLCLKVKRRKTRKTLGQIQKMRMSSMQMVSKLDMPLPLCTLRDVQLALLGHLAAQQTQTRPF